MASDEGEGEGWVKGLLNLVDAAEAIVYPWAALERYEGGESCRSMDARVTACAGVVSEEEGGSGHDRGRKRARGGGGPR